MFKITTCLIALLTLVACQQNPKNMDGSTGNGFTQVSQTELETLYDKRLSIDQGYVIVRKDGTFDGMSKGTDPLKGTWEMRDGYWCRVITVSKTFPTDAEDCQLWERKGTKVKGTRNKGKGKSFVYTVL